MMANLSNKISFFFFKLLEDKEKLLEKELQERLHKMEADKLVELERKEQQLYDRMQGESPDDRYVILFTILFLCILIVS